MERPIKGNGAHTILVCHTNKNLARLAQLNGARHGITVILAQSGKELLVRASGQIRPDAIVLSKDLKEPSTAEITRTLNLDPRLKGVPVIVLNGALPSIKDMLNLFQRPPWISKG